MTGMNAVTPSASSHTAAPVKLSIEQLGMVFGATPALEDVSFTVADSQVICVLGPSGCGKTTLLNVLAGFEAPASGRVMLRSRPITGPGPDRAVVFQTPALFPWLNVYRNIVYAIPRRDRPRYRDRAHQLIDQVGLGGFEKHYPYQLSGGMKQRVAIARALLKDPDVLLMDEPFGALDAQTRVTMQALLQDIWLSRQPTIIFITHDVEEAVFLADRVLVMSARPGRICQDIAVTFPRPRTADLLTDTRFNTLKKQAWHALHPE